MHLIGKIILGTVQFGLKYGISNTIGKPQTAEIFEMLDYAFTSGVQILDTAESYGDAIDIIGKYHSENNKNIFKVISKFKLTANYDLTKNVKITLSRLNIHSLYAYLLHQPEFIALPEVIKEFSLLKKNNLIRFAGVSIYTNEQFEQAIYADHIDVIQIPYNLFDNKNCKGDLLELAKSSNKIIHSRSAFLQGLFFKNPEDLTPIVFSLKKELIYIQELAKSNNMGIGELALNYCLAESRIHNVLIGVETLEQLKRNLEPVKKLNADVIKRIDNINIIDKQLINPALW